MEEIDQKKRELYGKKSSVIGMVLNVVLFLTKGMVGIIFHSISILADGINNLSDASSNIISFFGFKLASRPADKDHPYGHGRYEYLAGLMVSILIIVIGVELLKSGIEKLITPEETEFSLLMVAVLIFSIIIKTAMMIINGTVGKRIKSETLIATSIDSRNDIISTTCVLAGSIISHYTGVNLDGYIGVGVSLFVLISGVLLVKDTVSPLLGEAPSKETFNHIKEKILSYDFVEGCHDLIIHNYGPGRVFASVHVEMSDELDITFSHEIIDTIERDFITQEHILMSIHYDPINTKDHRIVEMKEKITEIVKSINPELSIHDLRAVFGEKNTNVIFDCLRPRDVDIAKDELVKKISELVKKEYPFVTCVITIDEPFV